MKRHDQLDDNTSKLESSLGSITALNVAIKVPMLRENENIGEHVLYNCKGTYSSTIRFVATDKTPDANP